MLLHTDLQFCRCYRRTKRIKKNLNQRALLLKLLENVVLLGCDTVAISYRSGSRADKGTGNRVFLQVLTLPCASCCFEVGADTGNNSIENKLVMDRVKHVRGKITLKKCIQGADTPQE